MQRVTVLGGGSFGTALAELCARQGQSVHLWMRNAERADAIRRTRHNPDYQSEFELSTAVEATTDLAEALTDAQWVIAAVPSQAMRGMLQRAQGSLPEVPLVLAAKGLENETRMTLDEVVIDVLGDSWRQRVLALSGPSFAREILLQHPTAVVLACRDEQLADRIGKLLFCDYFRAYSSTDMVGVELGGALKNVIAIAAGGVAGLGLGHNTLAALVTRGLAEITRFAVARGANPLTLAGLAGVGDLVLTCTGGLSRNRSIGFALGEGKTLEEAAREVKQVAEGIRTTAAAYELAQQLKIDAPITTAVYHVLYENMPVRDALLTLVRREPGRELEH